MQGTPDESETHTLRGATDRPALLTIHDVVEEMEPLATPELNDYLHPSVLNVELDDGLCAAGHLLRRERRSLSVDSRSGRPYWVAGE